MAVNSSGKYFFTAEAALWLTYIGFDSYGTWVRSDAREFAKTNAGVLLTGKNEKYFVNIGNFISVDEYNRVKLLNRQSEKLYNPPSQYYWKWNSHTQRLQYREMRINSDEAFNNLKFVGTAIFLNHLASAINAALSASSHNKELSSSFHLRFSPFVSSSLNKGISLSLSHPL